MADIHSKAVRSYNMSRVKGKNTKPEMIVRSFLFAHGFRYRLHDKKLPGKPDIVLSKYRIVIFVNGCFWHGHANCKYSKLPQTRKLWWKRKVYNTKNNDVNNICELEKLNWIVLIIWTCELQTTNRNKTLQKLVGALLNMKH